MSNTVTCAAWASYLNLNYKSHTKPYLYVVKDFFLVNCSCVGKRKTKKQNRVILSSDTEGSDVGSIAKPEPVKILRGTVNGVISNRGSHGKGKENRIVSIGRETVSSSLPSQASIKSVETTQSSPQWLSSRLGGPVAKDKLLKFAYEKKQRNGLSGRGGMASAGERNSCFVAGSAHRKLPAPTISSETSTEELSVWPRKINSIESLTTESEGGKSSKMEPESDSEPILPQRRRKRKVVVDEWDSTDEKNSVNGNKNLASSELSMGSEEELDDSGHSDYVDFTNEQKRKVIKFLNGSSVEELVDIPGCSEMKAKLLGDLRPFGGWEELVSVRYHVT